MPLTIPREGHPILVLTRRPDESVIIAGDIKITVVSIGPDRVRLGVEAPPHVRVDRQEIYNQLDLPGAFEVLNEPAQTSASEVPEKSPQSFRIVIEAYANEQLDPHEVAIRLIGLYEKLDEYCRLKYGRGLTLKEFEQYVRVGSRIPVGD